VDRNDLVIINPNVPHTETGLNSKPLEYIVLGISGAELASVGSFNGQFLILKDTENKELTACIYNVLREMELKNPGYEEVCQAYAEILIIRLMRNIAISAGGRPQGSSDNPHCVTVKRYIELHFKESLTLDQLAAEAHMNKYYLSHAFKREYGVSPIHYLLSLRIEESKYLLSETDLTMSQIAQVLGFSSPSYFSQVFHRTQGISPKAYRQNQRNT
jgi:AraC-like DNA-binding protein